MEDLARLGVELVVDLGGLPGGEHAEGLDRQLRAERDHLQRGDDRVASEQRREPRHAGGDVPLALRGAVVDQQAQVVEAAPDREVEELVVRAHLRRPAPPGVVRGGPVLGADERWPGEQVAVRRVPRGRRGPDDPRQIVPTARRQSERPAQLQPAGAAALRRGDRDDRVGRHGEGEVRGAPGPVPAVVAERHPAAENGDGQHVPTLRSLVAADLEDVRGIVGQLERELDGLFVLRVVDDLESLLECLIAEQPIPQDAELSAGQRVSTAALGGGVAIAARVGQVDRAPEVAAHRALEQDGPLAGDAKHRARQDPGVAEVEPQTPRVGVDVAERVREQEQPLMLQHLHGAEVGRGRDRIASRVQEADLGGRLPWVRRRDGGRGLGRGTARSVVDVGRRSRLSSRHRIPSATRAAPPGRP